MNACYHFHKILMTSKPIFKDYAIILESYVFCCSYAILICYLF